MDTINLGTGEGHSVQDIVAAAGRVTGLTVAPPVRRAGGDAPLRPVPALGQHSGQIRQEFGDRS